MSADLTYALVTPFRDEADNLPRLVESVVSQTRRPMAWILVDTGSTDGSDAYAATLAAEHDWITVTRTEHEAMRPGAPIVRAFKTGFAALGDPVDVVVKLDADVSFATDYFQVLLAAFADDSRLGIASGACFELEDGEWRERHVTGDHVRGATRAYRTVCLDEIGPLPEEMGWDGVDELKAAVLGWHTRTVAGIHFLHHRAVGQRDGAKTARWIAEGRCVYYMGYRPSYVLIRAAGRALRDRDPAAFAMPWAYLRCAVRREARYPDASVRSYLRRQQRLRLLPRRSLEALGRRA